MSFDRVLVALDGSPGSRGVQERALELVGPTGALIAVQGTARAILDAADRVDADAIVIARSRAALEVAARSRVPTIIVAPGSRAPERALLALDFSTPSMLAAEAGTAIAERLGVPAVALHVIDPRTPGAGSRSVEETRQGVASLVQLAANRRVPVTVQLGVPAEEIVAATGPTDLLVCGSRRAGLLERLFDPSVSTALLGEATGTVVVVPPPLGARQGREISRSRTARALDHSSS
jgi:nucleotide-binding universal stress UspA family protein